MEEWLKNFMGGVGDAASPQMLMLALMGYVMDQQQKKDLGGNPYKDALGSTQSAIDNMTNIFNQQQSGVSQNPQVTAMRNALQNRATTNTVSPLTSAQIQSNPIAQNMPTRYNPYSGGNYSVGNTQLIGQLLNMAQNNSNPTVAWGNDALQNMLKSRMTTRPMTA